MTNLSNLSNSPGSNLSMLAGALELLSDSYHDGKITKAQYEIGEANLRASMKAVRASVR
jgi:hypothetical protein